MPDLSGLLQSIGPHPSFAVAGIGWLIGIASVINAITNLIKAWKDK